MICSPTVCYVRVSALNTLPWGADGHVHSHSGGADWFPSIWRDQAPSWEEGYQQARSGVLRNCGRERQWDGVAGRVRGMGTQAPRVAGPASRARLHATSCGTHSLPVPLVVRGDAVGSNQTTARHALCAYDAGQEEVWPAGASQEARTSHGCSNPGAGVPPLAQRSALVTRESHVTHYYRAGAARSKGRHGGAGRVAEGRQVLGSQAPGHHGSSTEAHDDCHAVRV